MLERIEIENFRCLRSVDVPLRPLTVLIGANDTGKSTFIYCVRWLLKTDVRIKSSDAWRHANDNSLFVKGHANRGSIERTISPDNEPEIRKSTLEKRIKLAHFQLPVAGTPMECEGVSDDSGPPILDDYGMTLAALFEYFFRRDRSRFNIVEEKLKALIPGFEQLVIAHPSANRRRIDLVIENGLTITGDHLSSGVRLLLFFIGLAHHPTPPDVILIEEPETGIHPKRLSDVLNLLRSLTTGSMGGSPCQVIITTHSPYLLDMMDMKTDQVLVFSRCDDGSRTAQAVDKDRLKLFMPEFYLGEIWYNEGESALVAEHSR